MYGDDWGEQKMKHRHYEMTINSPFLSSLRPIALMPIICIAPPPPWSIFLTSLCVCVCVHVIFLSSRGKDKLRFFLMTRYKSDRDSPRSTTAKRSQQQGAPSLKNGSVSSVLPNRPNEPRMLTAFFFSNLNCYSRSVSLWMKISPFQPF